MTGASRGSRNRPQAGEVATAVGRPHPLAAWWTRVGALIIDLLITGAIELALLLIVWVLSGGPRLSLVRAETLAFEVGLPVAVLYAPLLLARRGERNGQTIGKQAMGIRDRSARTACP